MPIFNKNVCKRSTTSRVVEAGPAILYPPSSIAPRFATRGHFVCDQHPGRGFLHRPVTCVCSLPSLHLFMASTTSGAGQFLVLDDLVFPTSLKKPRNKVNRRRPKAKTGVPTRSRSGCVTCRAKHVCDAPRNLYLEAIETFGD